MQKGKPAKKYSQAARVHDIIRLIEARHGVAVEEMAEETGADRRTIYRDLIAIQEAGYPLDFGMAEREEGLPFSHPLQGCPADQFHPPGADDPLFSPFPVRFPAGDPVP